MPQALHIFKKDVRHLRYEIVGALFFVAAFAISCIRRTLSQGYSDEISHYTLILTLPVLACYLIARAIHAEPLPGDRQFWITRPYRWQSLLGAKALFVLAFLIAPIFIADAVILYANGFSIFHEMAGLVVEQVLITAGILIPIAALATVTTGLVQVVLTILGMAGIEIGRSLLLMHSPLWSPTDWVGTTAQTAVFVSIAAIVILWQYRRRKTANARILGAAGFAAALAISWLFPFTFAFWIQSQVSNRIDTSAVQIVPGAGDAWTVYRVSPKDDHASMQAPLRVTGLPPDTKLRPDALIVTIEAPDGTTKRFDVRPWDREGGRGAAAWPSILVDRAFLEKIGDQPVRLKGSAFATLYGNEKRTEVPFNTAIRIAVPGAGLCNATRTSTLEFVTCRYPFRYPPDAVSFFLGETGVQHPQVSYSPWPAQLDDNPVILMDGTALKLAATAPVVVTAEPLAHIRRDFEIPNLRLTGVSKQ